MSSRDRARVLENLRYGTLGAAAVIALVLGGPVLVDAFGSLAKPVLAETAAFLGVRPTDAMLFGLLAYVLFTLPALILAVGACLGVLRARRTLGRVVWATVGIAVLFQDRFGGYRVREALPADALLPFDIASWVSWGLVIVVGFALLMREQRAVDREVAAAIAEDRLEHEQRRTASAGGPP